MLRMDGDESSSRTSTRLPISDRDDATDRPATRDSGRDRHRFDRRGGRYGTVREHLLGITALLADGRTIHNGGKVVKNVAGFDLCKAAVGVKRRNIHHRASMVEVNLR